MTGARRQQKAKLHGRLAAAAVAALVLAAAGAGGSMRAQATAIGRIVADSLTGLALSGFDPVAYFTDRSPHLGEGEHEVRYRGAVWRFRNEGNRAAFVQNPDVYTPRFGGYDPIAVARGVAVPGHPLIWLISDDQLYLFSKVENRNRFADDTQHAIAAAERRWQEVIEALIP